MIDDPFSRKQSWKSRGKGPTGRNLCYSGCGREVPAPRRTSCSRECADAWNARNNPQVIARLLLERDKGICALCGLDTEALRHRAIGGSNAGQWDVEFYLEHWIATEMGYANAYLNQYDMRPDVQAAAEIRNYMDQREIYLPWRAFQEEQRRELAAIGFTDPTRRWWEADHIVPVIEGGGGCGPEGYRTLCLPCHRKETGKLAARLAAKRRLAKQPELTL